jgi:hypothetical protein
MRDAKTLTATPAVFQWAKCVQSPNPFAARWLGSTANTMTWQISLSRGGIFEFRSDPVSWPECGCSACPFSYGAAVLLVIWLILFWMYRRKLFLRI